MTNIHMTLTITYDLGVILDPYLTFVKHISKLTQVCSYQLGQLRRIRNCLSIQVAKQLVHAFVTC